MMIPNWPDDVWLPDRPGWEHTAVEWLFNWVSPELRKVSAFRRYPLLLSHVVLHDIQSIIEGHRRAYATARRTLAEAVGPESISVCLAVLAADAAHWSARLQEAEAVHARLTMQSVSLAS
jgi:hypothetical protein